MNNVNSKEIFRVRQYGRTELAQCYFPHLTPHAAWQKLRRWIELNPVLRQELHAGFDGRGLRGFTPRQVALIVEQLGEP